MRQALKRLSLEGNWTEVLETAETAMGMECGRGWLDLQRYVGRACYELGSYYDPIRGAVISGLRALLADYPQLPEMTMMDDTPTANAETQAWLKENAAGRGSAPRCLRCRRLRGSRGRARARSRRRPTRSSWRCRPPRAGRPQEGIEMLMREMAHERSGRARFHRKVQLAQLCVVERPRRDRPADPAGTRGGNRAPQAGGLGSAGRWSRSRWRCCTAA